MRLSADLDDPHPVDILQAWRRLSRRCSGLQGRVSSGGDGVHLRGFGFDGTPREAGDVRLFAGDHDARVDYDLDYTRKPSQILFTRKGGRSAGPWVDSPGALVDDYLQATRHRWNATHRSTRVERRP